MPNYTIPNGEEYKYTHLSQGEVSLRSRCRSYRQLRGRIQQAGIEGESCDDLTDRITDFLWIASKGSEPLTGTYCIEENSFNFPPRGISYKNSLQKIMQELGLIGGKISERNKSWHDYESYVLTTIGTDTLNKLVREGYYGKLKWL